MPDNKTNPVPSIDPPINVRVATKLDEMADLLEQQQANPFRIKAYRNAATAIEKLKDNIDEVFDKKGYAGMTGLPSIGKGIASAIGELLSTGRWSQLERLRGGIDPVRLLQTVPGIGPDLAARIHEQLHIDTLESLESAAFDGSLAQVRGIGPRRIRALQSSLGTMLGRTRRAHRPADVPPPEVALLLEVDAIYRQKAEADELPRIAPRRFNPARDAWLPVLHLQLKGWHFTAMYSNTALAHQLHHTCDWVVIYFYDDDHQEGQCTVVTETHGALTGLRVVRGMEEACRGLYAAQAES